MCERWRWKKRDRLRVNLDKFAKQERFDKERGVLNFENVPVYIN